MDIPSGGYVTISSVEGEKSIILTTENGDTSNVFSKGVRTGGENGKLHLPADTVRRARCSMEWFRHRSDDHRGGE